MANSTSTGWLDFKTSVSKFASSISMIGLMLAGGFLFLSIDRPIKLRPDSVRRIGKGGLAPPAAARRNRTLDSHRWVRPIRGVGSASLRESVAEARCRNEFGET